MRVITFSRNFPKGHPRAGEPTGFVEKVLKSLDDRVTYYPCCCEKCGWIGMSNCCEGGGAIADTGDYSDPLCPKCYSSNLDGELGEFEYMDKYYLSDEGYPKHHTIRAGNRWKVGDQFSPRVWSGKPYASKQIEFAPAITIKKIWDVVIEIKEGIAFSFWINGWYVLTDEVVRLAKNDGLEINDFFNWFLIHPKKSDLHRFDGQILCWNERLTYSPIELQEDKRSVATMLNSSNTDHPITTPKQ